ncbi:septum formation family protein [Spirillospora sp. NPDC049024]
MAKPPDADDVPESAESDPPAAPARPNRSAVIALVTGAVGLVVIAIGFAVAALVQTRRRGEKGRGLALAALAVSAVWLAAVTVLLVTIGGDADEEPPARAAEGPRASALAEGDCYTDFRQAGAKVFARAGPCTRPHQGEVAAKPDLPVLDYPGDRRLAAEGEKACRVQSSSLYAAGRGDEFTLFVARPDKKEWESGERTVTCLLHYTGGPKDFRLEKQWSPRSLLAVGDCVGTWSDTAEVDIVDCTTEHEAQVFAKLTLQGEKGPDEEEVYARCAERARRIFGPKPPAHLLLRLGGPNEREWAGGEKYALCLVAGKDGPLRRSAVPE